MARPRSFNPPHQPDLLPHRPSDFLWPAQQWVYDEAFKPAVWIDSTPPASAEATNSPEAPACGWVASSWHESSWSLLHGLDVIDPVPAEHIPASWVEKVCR